MTSPGLDDPRIRRSLHALLTAEGATPVDEAPLFGTVVDVLDLSTLHAFEIKSDLDDLRNLPHQALALEKTFPLVTLVTVAEHHAAAELLVGPAWGLWVVRIDATIDRVRNATPHAELCPAWVLGALRSEELRRIARANVLPASGGRADVTRTLLQRLGHDACVRLAQTLLRLPQRWQRCDSGPGPVLCAMEASLFPLPV